jgi:hypothetical protein
MALTRKTIRHRWKLIKSYIGWEDYIAVALVVLGALGYFHGPIPFVPNLTDFYMDNRSTLIGIGITVLIIDNLNEMYRRRAEKDRLILQMGSPDNAFAIEAVRQLAARKWLYDESLYKANLYGANLSKADLSRANLRGAVLNEANLCEATLCEAILIEANPFDANLSKTNLIKANLSKAFLLYANLKGANLSEANLSEASLRWANLDKTSLYKADLSGTDLSEANLGGTDLFDADLSRACLKNAKETTNEQLGKAKSLAGTTMPDGNVYDPAIHIEIARLRKESGLDM